MPFVRQKGRAVAEELSSPTASKEKGRGLVEAKEID